MIDFCCNTSLPSFLLRRGLVLLPSTGEPAATSCSTVDSPPPRHLVSESGIRRLHGRRRLPLCSGHLQPFLIRQQAVPHHAVANTACLVKLTRRWPPALARSTCRRQPDPATVLPASPHGPASSALPVPPLQPTMLPAGCCSPPAEALPPSCAARADAASTPPPSCQRARTGPPHRAQPSAAAQPCHAAGWLAGEPG